MPHETAPASVLTEAYAGLENQAIGLAEAAGLSPSLCRITPRRIWRRLPARLWPNPPAAVDGLEQLRAGLIIAAGGTAAAVAAAIRRRDRRLVVQVQNPRMPLDRFDLIVANRHDQISGPNVLVVRTALHRATATRLAAARTAWSARLEAAAAGRPLVAVLLGGSNGRLRLDPSTARALADDLAAMMDRDRAFVFVTPSRRSSADAIAAVRGRLEPRGGVVWDGAGENPYFGLLASAALIVVTADSISMVSEAVATSAPVLVAALPGRSRRIVRFLADLREAGRIRPFAGRFDSFEARPLDDTPEAGQEMRRRLDL